MSISIPPFDDYIGCLTFFSKENINSSTLVSALDIPAFLVPNELIAFFESYLMHIEFIKILRYPTYEKIEADNNGFGDTKYIALLSMKSTLLATKIISEFDGRPYSTLDSAICKLMIVASLVYTERKVTHNVEHKSNESFELEFLYRRIADTNDCRLTPLASADMLKDESCSSDMLYNDDAICVVCLESLRTESMVPFTMYCGHTFHCSCVVRLEPPQCPVCRFEHDMNSCLLTECTTCGWNGLLSSVLPHTQSSSQLTTHTASVLEIPLDRDIWVCLVCGYTGCGFSNCGHIQMHYESQQHAYAMNTDTRHVFDFAGQGYVHRLVVQQDAMSSSSSIPSSSSSANINAVNTDNPVALSRTCRPTMGQSASSESGTPVRAKLFEVNDPRYESPHRPSRAPLTSEEEERSVSLKLEMIAQQHSTLLAREMATQRLHYEQSIAKIRGFMQDEAAHLYQNVVTDAVQHSKASHSQAPSSSSANFSKSTSKISHNCNTGSNKNSDDSGSSSSSSKSKEEQSAIMTEWLLRVQQRMAQDKQKALKQLAATKAKLIAKENEYEGNFFDSSVRSFGSLSVGTNITFLLSCYVSSFCLFLGCVRLAGNEPRSARERAVAASAGGQGARADD